MDPALPAALASADPLIPLTTTGDVLSFTWSPDGKRLLFTRAAQTVPAGRGWQTTSDLWEITLDGQEPRLLVKNAAYPAYSPDGLTIAYLAFISHGQAELWLYEEGRSRSLGPADWGYAPYWQPYDQRILVLRQGRLWQIDRQGKGQPIVLAESHPLRLAQERDGVVSPDGRRVAYLATGAQGPELWVAQADGMDRRLLLRGELEHFGRPAWSPDGRYLVLSRTPSGAATVSYSELWLINADGSGSRPLTSNDQEESLPAWSPDGRRIAFLREGNLWVIECAWPEVSCPDGSAMTPEAQRSGRRATPSPWIEAGLQGQVILSESPPLTPPATIRVYHSPYNTCRPGVPVGQIDVFPLEDYLKWVVPAEVPATWPQEAVRAQAIAARTYAWRKILDRATWSYDVKDWTEDQVMCPSRQHPASDQAVNDTTGRYVAYQGQVINAMYSAENGSPTRSMPGVPYLQAVDDPVSFGRTRYGHGWGMSQWGAYRWASQYAWNHQQILAHYYTGVSIRLPAGPYPDATPPLISLLRPWPGWYVNSDRTLLVANVADDASGLAGITFTASYSTGLGYTTTVVATGTAGSAPWILDLPDQSAIQVMVTAQDAAGNQASSDASWGLDRDPPTGAISLPGGVTDSITVTVALTATERGPAGLAGVSFSNDWLWEGEDLYHQVGAVVSDTMALNGWAWWGRPSDGPGYWYGPYTAILPVGRAYRAWFRLKAADVLTSSQVAVLDVTDDAGATVLGLKRLRGIDFRQAGVYQEFYVDFNYVAAGSSGLEFRVLFEGVTDLWLDRVLVTSYPATWGSTATWRLSPGQGLKTVQAKFADRAGNVSEDVTATITLMDNHPPVFLAPSPLPWARSQNPTITVAVLDEISGLAAGSAAYRYSRDGGQTWNPEGWLSATVSGDGLLSPANLWAPAVPFGQDSATSNRIRWVVADALGHQAQADYLVPVDTVPPTARAASPLISSSPAFTVTWSGSDATSGLAGFELEVRRDAGPWLPWLTTSESSAGAVTHTAVFTGDIGHTYFFRARARDVAGNPGSFREGDGDTATVVGGVTATIVLGAGWNLISLPVSPTVPLAARGLLEGINGQGGQATQVARWYAGGWNLYLLGLPFNDFPIEMGKGYFVRNSVPVTWTIAGLPVQIPVAVNLYAGWNLIGVPYMSVTYTARTMAQSIQAQGGTPREIVRWWAGRWDSYIVGVGGTNFPIEPDKGYFVRVSTPSVWRP